MITQSEISAIAAKLDRQRIEFLKTCILRVVTDPPAVKSGPEIERGVSRKLNYMFSDDFYLVAAWELMQDGKINQRGGYWYLEHKKELPSPAVDQKSTVTETQPTLAQSQFVGISDE